MMLVRLVLTVVLLFMAAVSAAADPYVYTTLQEPNSTSIEGDLTAASGINDAGQIVGSYIDGNFVPHGFLLSGGVYTTIDPPGTNENPMMPSANGSGLFGINNAGQMVGEYYATSGQAHGFLDNAGNFSTVDDPTAPAGARTELRGISNAGAIVGDYFTGGAGTGVSVGFLLSGGNFTTIADPNAVDAEGGTLALGINNSGAIVGLYNYTNPADTHGFLLSGDIYSTIDFPMANERVTGLAINDAGLIFGSATDGFSDLLFFDDGGNFSVIPDPYSASGDDIFAAGINNPEDLVGGIVDISGNHGFLATPVPAAVPEPSSLMLLIGGLAALGELRRRAAHRG